MRLRDRRARYTGDGPGGAFVEGLCLRWQTRPAFPARPGVPDFILLPADALAAIPQSYPLTEPIVVSSTCVSPVGAIGARKISAVVLIARKDWSRRGHAYTWRRRKPPALIQHATAAGPSQAWEPARKVATAVGEESNGRNHTRVIYTMTPASLRKGE
jgi:hypothetical protein